MQKSEINNTSKKKPLKMLSDFFSNGFREFFERYEKKYSQKQKLTVFWIIMTLYVLMLAYLAYDFFGRVSKPTKSQRSFPSIIQEKKDSPLQASPPPSDRNIQPEEEKAREKIAFPLPEK